MGRKSLVTCCCRAATTGVTSASDKTVLSLMTEIWVVSCCASGIVGMELLLDTKFGERAWGRCVTLYRKAYTRWKEMQGNSRADDGKRPKVKLGDLLSYERPTARL